MQIQSGDMYVFLQRLKNVIELLHNANEQLRSVSDRFQDLIEEQKRDSR
jgi:hypothetical protein